MEKESIAYCGLNCALCQRKSADIKDKAHALMAALNGVNFSEVAKVIPFMNSKYKNFLKIVKFLSGECPGCRQGGGNPFCGIRKCAKKKEYFTCAECEQLCKRFKMLFRVHIDNEVQDNIARIKQEGIDKFVETD
ncbi:MAG: DUF3795 domain-containing protein [Candidatus Cloacimonetes bacterium]|nr:DUF3795 domain-containing protein [Candidatus Cloacimonadota bacterium]